MKRSTIRKAVKRPAKKTRKAASTDKHTMREFDAKRVPAVREFNPKQIQRIRETVKVSQPVLAAYLGVSSSTIKKWETGEKRPQGASLKLLNVVAKKGLSPLL